MCPRCDGMGTVSDIDLAQLYDDTRSLAEGALTIPGYNAGGWNYRVYASSGFVDPDKPIRDYTEQERRDFLYHEPVRMKIAGINMTYEGLVPRIQQSFLAKDVEWDCSLISGRSSSGRSRSPPAPTAADPAERGGPVVEDQGRQHRRRLRDADHRPGRLGTRPRRAVGGAAARRAAGDARVVRGDRARLPLARQAVGDAVGAARRSAPG